MTLRALMLFALATASAFAAPVPKELKKSDAGKMQGVWKEAGGTRWYFVDEKLYAGGQNTTTNKGIEYDIPLRQHLSPPEFDLVVNGKIQFHGIYKFTEEESLITYSTGTQPRPTDIAQPSAYRHTLRREGEAMK